MGELQLTKPFHPVLMWAALTNYMAFREREALRLCLKHFRQRNYLDIYEDLQEVNIVTKVGGGP